ncbi:hypothetical protein GOP47_0030588 [Adiantum capillus-veneris]|nr:hypothetical protein GOP47_0030588 [Adiantum capillus-veneris]
MTIVCAAEHLAKGCAGPASIFCGACGAVRYCCSSHQRLHWPEHKNDCLRFEEQMKLGAVLHEFPFTFTHESTFLINKGILSTCSFFQSQGVHTVGAWSAECDCNQTTLSKSGLGPTLSYYYFCILEEI